MKLTSTIHLLAKLIEDLANQCSTKYSLKDLERIRSRVKHEGQSFLTITLPTFADTFFLCVERGWIETTDFCGFSKSGYLPRFLGGFTSLVFDSVSGRSLDDSTQKTSAIMSVRQICYLYKKILLPCSDARSQKAFKQYQQTDDAVKRHLFVQGDIAFFDAVARVIVSSVCPTAPNEEDFLPHHGPGSTMEKLTGNRKFDYRRFKWFNQLNELFSPGLNLYPSEEWEHQLATLEMVDDAPVVRVVQVPKTQKSPRIIAMEPVTMQFLQQGVKDVLVKQIESNYYTAGHVNFSDQVRNQVLARENSVTKRLATVDLSEASDRVHNWLVKRLFAVNPVMSRVLQTTRSPLAEVDGRQLALGKFASMGSALCFPVESLVFFTLALVARLKANHVPLSTVTAKTLYSLSRDVYVYGDDIILPSVEVDVFENLLERFALKMNRAKSFVRSSFRESCGMDAYAGVDITPTYMRYPMPEDNEQVPHKVILSLVSTANQLLTKELRRAAEVIITSVERRVGTLPNVVESCEGIGWVDYIERNKRKTRYNRNYQRREVLTLVPVISMRIDKITGVPALAKCLLKLEQQTLKAESFYKDDRVEQTYRRLLISDKRHMARTPVRGALTLKRRWVADQ